MDQKENRHARYEIGKRHDHVDVEQKLSIRLLSLLFAVFRIVEVPNYWSNDIEKERVNEVDQA